MPISLTSSTTSKVPSTQAQGGTTVPGTSLTIESSTTDVPSSINDYKSLPVPTSVADELIIDSSSTVSAMLSERALSANRPEILVAANFLPTLSERGQTSAGKLLDVQFAARSLMVDNTATILAELETDPVFQTQLVNLQNNYESLLESLQDDIGIFSRAYETIDVFKRSLDLLDNEETIKAEIEKMRASRGAYTSEGIETTPPLGQYSTFRQILRCHLHFSDAAIATFSNSKAYGQIVSDLKNSLLYYSPKLMSIYSQQREEDRDPLSIFTETVETDDFTFMPSDIASEDSSWLSGTPQSSFGNNFDPTIRTNFEGFINSLPVYETERAKLLGVLISREMRMSAGIARLIDTNYDSLYNVQSTSKLIERIVGSTDSRIIGPNPKGGTYSSLLRFDSTDGSVVLPFETREIIDNIDTRKFIPGSIFLGDAVIQDENRPFLTAIEDFSSAAKDISLNNSTVLKYLLNFDDPAEKLHVSDVMKAAYQIVGDIARLSSTSQVNSSAAASIALLTLAQTNKELKHLLFMYTMELRAGEIAVATSLESGDDTSGDITTGAKPGTGSDSGGFKPGGGPSGQTTDSGVFDKQFEETTARVNAIGGKITLGRDPRKYSVGANVKVNEGNSATSANSGNGIEILTSDDIEMIVETNSYPQDIEKIVRSALKTTANNSADSKKTIVNFANGSIESLLNNGVENNELIFNRIAEFANSLDVAAKELSLLGPSTASTSSGHLTATGLTRYGRYSGDTILMLAFELVTSILNEGLSAQFTGINNTTGAVTIEVNTSQNNAIKDYINGLIGKRTAIPVPSTYTTISQILGSIYTKALDEDSLIRDLIDILTASINVIVREGENIVNFFDQTENTTLGKRLNDLLNDSDYNDVWENLSSQQLILNWTGTKSVMNTVDQSLVPENQLVTEGQKIGLDTLLREPEFKEGAGSNLKILGVGLSAGTLNALQNAPFYAGLDTSLESETADLITVKVYRRDPEFAEIIFRPLSFIFDMSKFALEIGTPSETSTLTDYMKNSVVLQEVSPVEGLNGQLSLEDVKQSQEYLALSSNQKTEMFKNHLVSVLLNRYLKIMTGIDLSEHTFIANERILRTLEIDNAVREILIRLPQATDDCLSSFGNNPAVQSANESVLAGASISSVVTTDFNKSASKSLSDALFNSSVTVTPIPSTEGTACAGEDEVSDSDAIDSDNTGVEEESEDDDVVDNPEFERQYDRLLNSLLFRSSEGKIRVQQPKLFERIFLVPVDPDHFIIDEMMTQSTPAGRQALKSLSIQNCIVEETDNYGNVVKKIQRRTTKQGNFEFSEYFGIIALGASS